MAEERERVRLTMDFHPADVERAMALVPALEAEPVHRARGSVTRQDVLRVAVAEGLAVLEKRYGRAEAGVKAA